MMMGLGRELLYPDCVAKSSIGHRDGTRSSVARLNEAGWGVIESWEGGVNGSAWEVGCEGEYVKWGGEGRYEMELKGNLLFRQRSMRIRGGSRVDKGCVELLASIIRIPVKWGF